MGAVQGLFYGVKMVYNYGLWLQAGRNPTEYTEELRELCKAFFFFFNLRRRKLRDSSTFIFHSTLTQL